MAKVQEKLPLLFSRKRNIGYALIALLLIAPLASIIVPSAQPQNESQTWYNADWHKRRPITIDNTLNPNNLTNFQIKINLNYDSDMKTDFSDLRFTETGNSTLIPYWIESYTPSTSATIWIRVPNIPASNTTTIHMYYDNPIASDASNGTDSFEFFDNFPGNSLNPTKWTEDAVGNITHTVNNYFRFEDATKSGQTYWIADGNGRGSQHHAQWTPISNFIVDFTSRINDLTATDRGQGFFGLLAPDNTVIGVAGHQDHNDAISPSRAVVVENAASSLSLGISTYNRIYFKGVSATDSTNWRIMNNGSTLRFYDNDGPYLEAPISSSVSKLAIIAGAWEPNSYIDYVQESNMRIRKYTPLEPTSQVGFEEDYRMKAKITWWNPVWRYRKPINLTENSGTTLSNYQVKLTIDYIASKMNPDFSDLRFIDKDQTSILPYWIESAIPSVSAVVWIKVPNIPASGNQTIYMYYGNPSTNSIANGKATFEFYEDFETEYEGPSLWTDKQPLPDPRADPSAAVYNGKIYVFGGYYFGTGDVRRETYEYDPLLNSWTRKADMPSARWGPIAVEFNGLIYVFSGTVNVNEVYNPTTETWTTKNPPPFYSNQGLMAAKYGDRIHLFYNLNHYEYDPATDSYTPKAPMPTPRTWAACAVVGNRIYLIGGYRDTVGAVNANEAYDPATNSWTTQAPMPTGKYGGGREQPVINGRIYVTHGRSVEFYVSNYVYDPSTNSWEQKSPAVHPRAGSAAAVINNKMYVIGGVVIREGEIPTGLNYNEQYDPATDTWIESPWNFSDPSKVKRDPSAKYEGGYGLLVYENETSSIQFAEHPQNFSTCAVDFYWDVTDALGVNTTQPKGRLLLADANNPNNGALYYYEESGAKFYWYREGLYTLLHYGSWNTWYPITVVWSGTNSRVVINGIEHSVSAAQISSDRIYFDTMQQTKMFVDLLRVRKHASLPPAATFGAEEEPATIQSCDSSGNMKASFSAGEALYVKGSNLKENTDYKIYIVNDVAQWNDGDPIPTRITGTTSTVYSDNLGDIQPTLIWNSTLVGNYDIILDVFENGLYDSSFDALNSFEVTAPLLHDIAVINISPSETSTGRGYFLPINVTVANQGDFTEDVNLTVFANDTAVDTLSVTLGRGQSSTVNASWNTTGFSLANYVISSYATPVLGETDISDNTLNSTNVFVTIPGDVNNDRLVDVHDMWELGKAYASDKTDPEWNPNADINNDGTVDNDDIRIINGSLGQRW
ncbi:MAG TPA: DUF2341 domain-containing protein [Candidatus Bathyarchaeia archaeon]|nr:DUF2341 domain-containing protein [Candidatus Bathyarchaeia archaeon]